MSERSYFTQQRDLLLREIDISFGHVLANINKLNRGLEGVIDVGNEFSSVEALWSQFENVMAKDPEVSTEASAAAAAATTAQEGQEDKTVHEGDSRNETQMDDEKRKR